MTEGSVGNDRFKDGESRKFHKNRSRPWEHLRIPKNGRSGHRIPIYFIEFGPDNANSTQVVLSVSDEPEALVDCHRLSPVNVYKPPLGLVGIAFVLLDPCFKAEAIT